jgi:hypothetical protein
MTHRLTEGVAAALRWVWAQVDLEDVAILLAIWLLAYGFSLCWRPGTYLAPAAVLLWMYLPSRYRFVVPPPAAPEKPNARDK